MLNKYIFAITILYSVASFSILADNNTTNLENWSKELSQNGPEFINGVKIYRPTINDGQLSVSDFFETQEKDDETVLTKSLLFCINNLDRTNEYIETIEPDKKRFLIDRYITDGDGKNEMKFSYKIAFQVTDGIISFVASNITAEFKEKGFLPRKVKIEKLKPAEKEDHKKIIENFTYQNSLFLQNLSEFVNKQNVQNVSHWQEIANGDVVEGMNETEVMIAAGRPISVREQSTKTLWMYSNDFVVVFTDKIVSSVVR